jgi:4a-hydroxytetrahydrobiopterin dehydratase
MSELRNRRCRPLTAGTAPISAAAAAELLAQLAPGWRIADDGGSIRRGFGFEDFYETMSFVNAVAWIANAEDHHPDLEVGYNYCRMSFSTHSVGGLSENDFICAAKVDALQA